MEGGLGEETMLLPDFWRFARHSPNVQLLYPLLIWDWCPSSCCPGGDFQSGCVCIHSKSMPFKQTLLRNWQFLPLSQPPLIFTASSYKALFSQCWSPGLHGLAWGQDQALPRCFFWFLSRTWMWDCPFPLLPLLCYHHLASAAPRPLHPGSTLPTCLDECFFFKSLVVGLPYSLIFWQFWFYVFRLIVILLMVVQGGKACLPTPPSWLEVCGILVFQCSPTVCEIIPLAGARPQ